MPLFSFCHTKGGSRQSPREGANFKREGVRAGVSDLFLSYPTKLHHGLYIEMKRRGKRKCTISKLQWEWIERVRSVGYRAAVCYGWEEARDVILEYLGEK